MRKPVSIGMSAGMAAVLTHGVVRSALNFNERPPISTYQGFFQRVAAVTERLWSYAHGWQPMSHIQDFGYFYAPLVHLTCPLAGFALFWAITRHKVGSHFWKPLAAALLLTVPDAYIDALPAYALPWVEATRTALVVLAMVWTAGGFSVQCDAVPLAVIE